MDCVHIIVVFDISEIKSIILISSQNTSEINYVHTLLNMDHWLQKWYLKLSIGSVFQGIWLAFGTWVIMYDVLEYDSFIVW